MTEIHVRASCHGVKRMRHPLVVYLELASWAVLEHERAQAAPELR